jgi:hypothetical protein
MVCQRINVELFRDLDSHFSASRPSRRLDVMRLSLSVLRLGYNSRFRDEILCSHGALNRQGSGDLGFRNVLNLVLGLVQVAITKKCAFAGELSDQKCQ